MVIQRAYFTRVLAVALACLACAAIGLTLASCGRGGEPSLAVAALAAPAVAQETDGDADDTSDPGASELLAAPITGDLDQLIERHYIRVLVPLSRSLYYVDKGRQFGLAYDGGMLFEKWLNERLKSGVIKVQVAFLPVNRDQIFPLLAAGHGDLAMGNLTVTDERRQLAEFSTPFMAGVNEIVVTASDQPALRSLDDLAGRDVHVRRSSSYFASLLALNEKLQAAGKSPVRIVEAPPELEDEDLLEMINAGMIPATIVDSHVAAMWKEVYDQLQVWDEVRVRENGAIAWAVRKNCPKLLAEVSAFSNENKQGSLQFNMIYKKYLNGGKKLGRAADAAERKKFVALIESFRKYGKEYDLPWLFLAALSYQESRLDQSARSASGAVGIMQLLPSTAASPEVAIEGVESSADANVHAGTKYLRWLADKFVNDPQIDRLNRGLLVCASYNAGPGRIAKLRKKAASMGLDPNRWFGNVEILVAKEIGRETIQYVSNIYKYYVAYGLVVDQLVARGELKGD